MKRWTPALVALGLFALLLGYVLVVERGKEAPPSAKAQPSPTPAPVLDIARQDLQALTITVGDRSLRLEQEGTGWWIAQDRQASPLPAEPSAVWFPIDELAHLEARLIISEEVADPEEYGLDPIALTLAIETRDGAVEQLHIGRETPDGTAYYVQRRGDPRLYTVEHYRIQPFHDWLLFPPYQPTPTPASE